MAGELLDYRNVTLHGGVNQRLNGRLLAENEATELLNADISVPGIRTKRKSPRLVALLGTATTLACPLPFFGEVIGNPVTVFFNQIAGADGYRVTLYSGATVLYTIDVSASAASVTFPVNILPAPGTYSVLVLALGNGVSTLTSTGCAAVNFDYSQNDLCQNVDITQTNDFAAGSVGVEYFGHVVASGGTWPYTYAVVSGALPTGLTLYTNLGLVNGTPTVAGIFDFVIAATDASGCGPSSINLYTVQINTLPALTVAQLTAPEVQIGQYAAKLILATGGTAPYTYTLVAGSLPPGMALNAATGTVSGTPTVADMYVFTIRAVDSFGATGSAECSIEVLS